MAKNVNAKTDKAKLNLKVSGYDEVSNTPFDVEYVVQHIKLPSDPVKIPNIIGWSGPARSGTTGLLFLLASHPEIDQAFFQPLKTILRNGGPTLEIKGDTICLKEVFRSCCAVNDHDPIAMLLAAGVPANKIAWVSLLRDPVQAYASWDYCLLGHTPEHFAMAQRYSLDFYNRYKELGVNIVPFAYDLLKLGEEKVLKAVFNKSGIELNSLKFDLESIEQKLVYREESARSGYFDVYLRPTLERNEFVYSPRQIELPEDVLARIKNLCQKDYDEFYDLSRRELGI